MSTVVVRRRRRRVPAVPQGEILLEAPPEPEKPVPPGLLARALPAAMLLGSLGVVAVMGVGNPSGWVFGGMFALSSLGMLMTGGPGRGERSASVDEERRDYLRYLARMRSEATEVARRQRLATQSVHPAPAAWPEVLASGRLWEREPADEDFAVVRVGTGPQNLATELVAPRTGPVEGLEPVSAGALKRFLAHYSVVDGLPVSVDLRAARAVWLDGDPEVARALARAVVVQFAMWHSPAETGIAILRSAAVAAEWEWAKWLPHSIHAAGGQDGEQDREQDEVLGGVRMVTADADDTRRWWAAQSTPRQLLLVVDGPIDGPGAWAAADGVTVLRVGVPSGRRATPSVVRLRLGEPGMQPDALDAVEALAFARRLARYRPDTGAADAPDRSASGQGLPEMLGMAGPLAPGPVAALRRDRTAADRMRVPLGLDPAGRPVLLDLKESARGGSGPHGLCIGATGSGKSELLRSLVVGLVLSHPPEELNLVLVDFKGGATFLGLAGLPHVSAVITNLADELTLVDRMADAISGELNRRQEVLRAAGNLANIHDYEQARATPAGAALAPLPWLLIVVDEFSELLAQRPEFVDLFVMIGRLGRSLGLHLLLASQRLDEGRLRGLDSHLSYRIALRTFSASESRAVLGVPDAHRLPPVPGAAILSAGTDQLVRFRSAYVSGGVAGESGRSLAPRRPFPFIAGSRLQLDRPVEPEPAPVEHETGRTVLSAVVDAVTALGGHPAHQVWLPPLGEPPALAEVLGTGAWAGLRVPIGLIDRPAQQRRDPLLVDLSGAAGHVVVAGGPRSGKSTAVRTLVSALALTHRPGEVGVHAIDLGGGALDRLTDLPHVGSVAGRREDELIRRVLAELVALIERRENLFRDNGIGSIEEFRARRAAGGFPDEPATDVIGVIDGYGVLCGTDGGLTGAGVDGQGVLSAEEAAATVAAIAARGLAFGVHLVVTVGRWAELRPAVRDHLGTRIELRLGDPGDSEIDRRRAAVVPLRPGHGLVGPAGASGGAASSGLGSTALGGAAGPGAAAMVVAAPADPEQVQAAPGFPAVRLLPRHIPAGPLLAEPGTGLPLGLDEERLALVELDPLAEPHLLCFADAESGKTSLLRLIAAGIAARYTPRQARIIALDPRRGLLGDLPGGHLLAHSGTGSDMADVIAGVVQTLRKRLPGPDVSPAELRDRSWWHGAEAFVLVDDYDLVAPHGSTTPNPLLPLVEFLPQAGDVGLHLVVVRRTGGAARALYDPVLGRLRELGGPILMLNGSPEEGALVGNVKPRPQPPGRGMLIDRKRGPRLMQLAWQPPAEAR